VTKNFRTLIPWFRSDNPKSKINNPKWLGVVTLVVAFVIWGGVVEAQQPKTVSRIGYLSNTNLSRESERAAAIRLALRERGYIDGQNIAFEFRYAEQKLDQLPELAAELVRLKVDIIVAIGGPTWVQAPKNATKTIPIVMGRSETEGVR